jgi:hypothetical protein
MDLIKLFGFPGDNSRRFSFFLQDAYRLLIKALSKLAGETHLEGD